MKRPKHHEGVWIDMARQTPDAIDGYCDTCGCELTPMDDQRCLVCSKRLDDERHAETARRDAESDAEVLRLPRQPGRHTSWCEIHIPFDGFRPWDPGPCNCGAPPVPCDPDDGWE